MRLPDLRQSTLLRWGVAIAALLVAQSLILGGLFWQLTSARLKREISRDLRRDCAAMAALSPDERIRSVADQLRADVHRERFLAVFTAGGQHLAGNVAHLPPGLRPDGRMVVATVEPTQLPGITSDIARLTICAMPDGSLLLSGRDRDQEQAVAHLVERALAISLVPALVVAVAGGWLAANLARRRLDAVRLFSEQVVAGDLTRRLPVSPRFDGFDMLCAQINAMLDRIETLMIELKGVGDDIAHQLRTPLTLLRARLEREIGAARTHADFARAGSMALGEIDQALSIISALLRIREIDDQSRRNQFGPVDLAELVTDVVELYAPMAACRGNELVLRIDDSPTVQGDRDLLMEAMSNLVDNAVKYASERTVIDVRLGGGRTASVTVTNAVDGSEFPTGDTLFRRFHRGCNAVGVDGSGLGLSLVRAIADLHRATIRLVPDPQGRIQASLVFEEQRHGERHADNPHSHPNTIGQTSCKQ